MKLALCRFILSFHFVVVVVTFVPFVVIRYVLMSYDSLLLWAQEELDHDYYEKRKS